MKYFKLSEKQVRNLKIEDVAVLSVISNRRTSQDKCYCYQNEICNKLSISERQVRRNIRNLEDAGVFTITKEKSEVHFKNIYHFEKLDTNFILVNSDILNLESDEIGFLIKCKAIAYDNGLSINFNKEQLAKILHIGKSKLNSLLNSLIVKGFISYSNGTFLLSGDMFKDYSKYALKNAKRQQRKQVWINEAVKFMNDFSETKEAEILKYYFIDKKNEVKFPIALIKDIITGKIFSSIKNTTSNDVII